FSINYDFGGKSPLSWVRRAVTKKEQGQSPRQLEKTAPPTRAGHTQHGHLKSQKPRGRDCKGGSSVCSEAAVVENERNPGKGGIVRTSRHYKTKPTHGIGRYRHLVKVLEPKKKKAKVELRAINVGTDYEYGVLNIHLTAYDMTLAESYARYVHRLCNQLSIKVEESYAMPTKTMEVMRLPDQGNKMVLDSVLTTHERVVQISGLSATFAEIFLEILQINLPEGVRLSVREHTEEDFKGRFKARPELEELLAKLN
uniref:Mitochondrial ribosomal protein L48 n=1 Tax=Rattus norvegicus TaxID=10116 RepID=A0ABK0M8M4_RAT